MKLHARSTEITARRTLCGLRMGRGVHRVGIGAFTRHVERRADTGVEACAACRAVIDERGGL